MRCIVFLTLAFSLTANLPLSCSHALGNGVGIAPEAIWSEASDASDASGSDAVTAAHGPHDHHGGPANMVPGNDPAEKGISDHDKGCGSDCHGGVGCDGCVVAVAALPDAWMRAHFSCSGRGKATAIDIQPGMSTAMEPPPPRA